MLGRCCPSSTTWWSDATRARTFSPTSSSSWAGTATWSRGTLPTWTICWRAWPVSWRPLASCSNPSPQNRGRNWQSSPRRSWKTTSTCGWSWRSWRPAWPAPRRAANFSACRWASGRPARSPASCQTWAAWSSCWAAHPARVRSLKWTSSAPESCSEKKMLARWRLWATWLVRCETRGWSSKRKDGFG